MILSEAAAADAVVAELKKLRKIRKQISNWVSPTKKR